MINIKKFVARRKALNLSQSELCEGICTQATLSKFENLGQVPSMRILSELCDRLDLPLSELLSSESEESEHLRHLFQEANMAIIGDDFNGLAEIVQEIDDYTPAELNRHQKQMLLFLKGRVEAVTKNDPINALFYYNQILTDQDVKKDDLVYYLALTGYAQVYDNQGDTKKALQYYDQVFKHLKPRDLGIEENAIAVLAILYSGGKFYYLVDDFEKSTNLLNTAYKICSDYHFTYYLSRILYQLALNVKAQEKGTDIIQDYLNDAKAFARLNKNFNILQKIENFGK